MKRQLPLRMLGSLMAAALLYLFLSHIIGLTFPSIAMVKCTLEMADDGAIQVFYWNGVSKRRYHEKYSSFSKPIRKGKKDTAIIRFQDVGLRNIRIDFGYTEGIIKIYKVQLLSRYAKRLILSPKDIYDSFVPGTEKVSMHLKEDHVEIVSKTSDPYIVSDKLYKTTLNSLAILVPIPFALLLFVYCYRFDYRRFHLLDVKKSEVKTKGNIDSLDGLRGLAIMMVIADHCYGRFTGVGATGVWIFMALSGFLLARPFAANPGSILSKKTFISFFEKRCRRIMPLFYTYICIVYLVRCDFDKAVKHFLFLQGAGHLWVVPQEIVFYLLIPFFLIFCWVILRGRPLVSGLCAIGLAIAANIHLTVDIFSLYGMANQNLRLYAGVFLAGVAAAYLLHYTYSHHLLSLPNNRTIACISGYVGFILILFFILGSTERTYGGTRVFSQIYFEWYGAAAAFLIVCIVNAKGTFLERLLAWCPLSSLGIVSYGVYLFHPIIMGIVDKGINYYLGVQAAGPVRIVYTVVLSYIFAVFTYRYIEKPCMKVGDRW